MKERTYFFPTQRYAYLPRERLVQKALSGNPALIKIVGGGGAGKTTAAVEIARAFCESPTPDVSRAELTRVAIWVRLSPGEARPEQFWSRVVQTIFDAGVAENQDSLHRLVAGDASALTPPVMINFFDAFPLEVLLIFDDGHKTLTSETEKNLSDVLQGTSRITVIVSTRRPIPKFSSSLLRATLPVNILRADDLSFSPREVMELVQVKRPALSERHSQQLSQTIYERTKGWPLATQALIIEAQETDASVDNMRRSTFIRELVAHLFETIDTDLQITLCVSALFEEVSVETFAQILDLTAEESQARLDAVFEHTSCSWVERGGTRWYRHHDLVKAEIRAKAKQVIDACLLRSIYRAAAIAFQHVSPGYAREAAIQAEDWDLLTGFLINRGDFSLDADQQTSGFRRIPNDVQMKYPVIAAFALLEEYAVPSGRLGRVIAGFRILASKALVRQSEKYDLAGLIATTMRMIAARLSGNQELATGLAERARTVLELLSGSHAEHAPQLTEIALAQTATTMLHAGNFTEIGFLLEPYIGKKQWVHLQSGAHAYALAACSNSWLGTIKQAEALTETAFALEVPAGWHNSYIGAGLRIAASICALERGDSSEAQAQLDYLKPHESTIEHWPFMTYVTALIVESQFGPGEALDYLNHQIQRRKRRSAPLHFTKSMLETLKRRLMWHSGVVLPKPKFQTRDGRGEIYCALSRGENEYALGMASRLAQDHLFSGNPRVRSELLLLKAESAQRSGQPAEAAEAAQDASLVMHRNGLTLPMRVLTRDAAHQFSPLTLWKDAGSASQGVTRDVRPLTPAELRALNAVMTTGNVREAAQLLYLSPETVKSYMKQVYRKLGVTKRSDAIRIANEAGMLAELAEQKEN